MNTIGTTLRRLLGLGLILAVCFGPTLVAAQTQEDRNRASDEADRIRQQQQRELLEQRRRLQEDQPKTHIEVTPEIRNEDVGPEQCWQIERIILTGVTVLSEGEQEDVLEPYEGECLRLGAINALLNDITTAYFDAGYITSRAYIEPNQDLNTGVLKILIVEGQLEGIRLEDNKGGDSVALDYVFPNMTGKPFNLRHVEQGLDQINRLPSNNATIAIEPGTEPGSSFLVVRNEARDPYTYSLSRNTVGSPSTGNNQYSATGFIDNAFGISDGLVLSYTRTPPDDASKYSSSLSASYSVPWGYTTGNLSASYSQFSTEIELANGDFADSTGSTLDFAAGLDRNLYRDQNTIIGGSVELGRKRVRNYFTDSVIDVSSYNETRASVGLNLSTVLLGGLVTGDYTVTRGVDLFNAEGNPDEFDKKIEPTVEFLKQEASLGYTRQFGLGSLGALTVSSDATGQFSEDILYSAQQLSIGGYYTVRGFPNVSLSGDSGFYVRNEAEYTPQLPAWAAEYGITPSLFVAYDYGKIFKHHEGSDRGSLQSYAYGARFNHSAFSFEVMTAEPISYPNFIGFAKPELHFLASVTAEGSPDFLKATENSPTIFQDRGLGLDDWIGPGWFVGAETGVMDFTLNDETVGGAGYGNDNKNHFKAIRVGRKFGNSRIYARAYLIDETTSFEYDRYDLSFETKLLDSPIAPFIGGSIGYLSYQEFDVDRKNSAFVVTDGEGSPKRHIFLEGPMYGIKAGLIYEGPGISAHATYEIVGQEANDPIGFDGVNANLEIEQSQTFALGVDLKF